MIKKIVDCKKCFYFNPKIGSEFSGNGIPASCSHEQCFAPVKSQTFNGEPYIENHRIRNISDLNFDNKCSKFTPFYYEKMKLWFIFKTKVKTKGVKDEAEKNQ